MSELVLVYWLSLGGRKYPTRAVRGTEEMSRVSRFEVTLTVEPDDGLDPDALVRSEATLHFERDGAERNVTGIVTDIKRKATQRGAHGGGEVVVVLESKLALLRYRSDIRVFRTKTAPQIAALVMQGLGVTVEQRLSQSYKVREYTVQFRELDLDFASRLLEDEGIFYFIDEAGVVTFGDNTGAYESSVGLLPFRHDAGMASSSNPIVEIGSRGTMTAGKVTLRDFNPVHPRLDMDVSAKGPTANGPEYYDYPGEYEEPAEGQRKATLRAEALRCAHHRVSGRSMSAAILPGARFETLGTPAGYHDGEFVVTRVEHDWTKESKGYAVAFEALPAKTVFRPPVVTEAPVQTNPLSGFVTGPAGSDIHTDEWGRVKVHFPWDRLQPKDDTCSYWIPVLQDNTGHSSAISRTGWEVLCHFMEGDLDRPIVLGRVYNGIDGHASPLPERKTRTSLRSLSSPRVEGEDTPANFIQFEDQAGFEGILMHAQKDQNVIVKNDKKEQVDDIESLQVRGNETINIDSNHTLFTKKHLQPDVVGNQDRTIGGNHSIKVGSSLTESVDGNSTLKIGGSHTRNLGKTDSVQVVKNTKELVGGVDLELSLKTNTDLAEKTRTLLVGGAVVEVAKNSKTEQTGLGKIETIGGIVFSKADGSMGTTVAKNRKTNVGGLFRVESIKELVITGLEKLTKKALSASYEGTKTVTFKVGSTEINMKEGRIELNAKDSIVIKTNAENKQGSKTSTQI